MRGLLLTLALFLTSFAVLPQVAACPGGAVSVCTYPGDPIYAPTPMPSTDPDDAIFCVDVCVGLTDDSTYVADGRCARAFIGTTPITPSCGA